jgi:hypothetical protein
MLGHPAQAELEQRMSAAPQSCLEEVRRTSATCQGRERPPSAFERIRDDCYDAVGAFPNTIDVEQFVEEVFALVTKVNRETVHPVPPWTSRAELARDYSAFHGLPAKVTS